MQKKNVLANNSLPTRLPIQFTAIVYLLLDKFQAVEWVWGAAGVFVVLLWIGAIIAMSNEEHIDLLNKKSGLTLACS